MLTSRFEEALIYAFDLHKNQTRKSISVPYFAHLMGVAALVLEANGDEDTGIAALLHDAVEDQGGLATLEEIRKRFGERVAGIVEICSDTFVTPKPPWRKRKAEYMERLHTAPADARLVSVADKLYNVRTTIDALRTDGERVWDRFKGGKDGTLWYYRTLVDVFSETGSDGITEEYIRAVVTLEQLAE